MSMPAEGNIGVRPSFVRSVGVLVGGAAMAHAISALALPVLSRLYTPSHFSALAVFSSLLGIFGVAANLRFDVAVPIPESRADATDLMGLSLICALTVSLMLLIPAVLMPSQIAAWLRQPTLAPYLWLLPVGVFLTASYSALQSWFVRERSFQYLAFTRMTQSTAAAGTQVGLGMFGISPFGLLLGYVLNAGAACIALGARWLRACCAAGRLPTVVGMRAMAVQYQRFPKYSTLEALSNSAAIQLPVILIAAVAVGPEAGFLTMAMYVMQAPMALIGTAIGQVYLSRAPDEYRLGRLSTFTADILGGLIKAGVGPLLCAGIVAPVAFGLVFGQAWVRAGDLVAWMTPWFIMQFLASPISMALHVTGRQRAALVLQLFALVVRVAAVWVTAQFDPHWVTQVYAVSGFVIYFVYITVILSILSIGIQQVARQALRAIAHVGAWIAVGFAIRLIIVWGAPKLIMHLS